MTPSARECPEGEGGGWRWASLCRVDVAKAPRTRTRAAGRGALSLDEGTRAQGIVGAEAPGTIQCRERGVACAQLASDLEGGAASLRAKARGAQRAAREGCRMPRLAHAPHPTRRFEKTSVRETWGCVNPGGGPARHTGPSAAREHGRGG